MNNLFYKKMDNMIKSKEQEILELRMKKSEIEEKIKNINEEKDKIYGACYLDCYDSFRAISYLVSMVEGEDYCIKEMPCQLRDSSFIFNDIYYDYNFIFLIKNGTDDVLRKEWNELLIKFEDEDDNFKYLFEPSDKYVQIACLIRGFKGDIYYKKGVNFCVGNYNTRGEYSTICDERYNYIIDYMDTVVDYRLSKPDLEVTFDEMKVLALKFVKNYKKRYGNETKRRVRSK